MAQRPTFEMPDKHIGQMFDDRYEVLELIGEGGMGKVYKARQVAMDRMVALKVIHPDHTEDETVVKRFFREMKTTSRIAHPNTVSVYDFGETKNKDFFLAMELLDGVTLSERLENGPLPLDTALAVGVQILKALSAAHKEHVIHRDLKSENIMLLEVYGEADQVRVLDFGIATFASTSDEGPSARVTASGIMVGTPSYVSPEQIGGEELDQRADLYSFGVLFFEMLTGRLPFHDPKRPLRVLQMHMTEPPPRASSLVESLPTWLDELLLRLLAKYPEDRPDSADVVIATIESPPAPAPPPEPRAGFPFASIAKIAALGVALMMAALVGGTIAALFL